LWENYIEVYLKGAMRKDLQ